MHHNKNMAAEMIRLALIAEKVIILWKLLEFWFDSIEERKLESKVWQNMKLRFWFRLCRVPVLT